MNILDYRPELKEHIRILNFEWLEKYFSVEPNDVIQLSDPANEILAKGGHIYYAEKNGQIVGTVALLRVDKNTFELAKMAVTENEQGAGIGKGLLEHCIRRAREIGAKKLVLYSNTKLETAIALYRKFGFRETEPESGGYQRCNVKMELNLKRK